MKTSFTLLLAFVTALSAATLCGAAPREDEYLEVEVEELLENPQNYWALGIVFRDTLLGGPSRKPFKMGGGRYYAFPTEQLGTCYADEKVVPRLEILRDGAEYIFSGTVLQRGRRYYIVVKDLQPAASGEGVPDGLVERLGQAGDPSTAQRVAGIVEAAEKALYAYVLENELQGVSLLTPNSKYRKEALGVIRASVADAEREYELTARELLTQFVEMILIQSTLQREDKAAGSMDRGGSDEAVTPGAGIPVGPVIDERPNDMHKAVGWGSSSKEKAAPTLKPGSYQLKLLPYSAKVLGGGGAKPAAPVPGDDFETHEFSIEELPLETEPAAVLEPEEEGEPKGTPVPMLRVSVQAEASEPVAVLDTDTDAGAPIGW